MNKQQRVFVKQRTNRRVRNKKFEGPEKRKNMGRRKDERLRHTISKFSKVTFIIIGSIALAVIVLSFIN